VSRPRDDEVAEDHVSPGLEALQPALLDELVAEPAEAVRGPVVAEACARHQVELGQLLALVPCGEQRGAAVELIDDLEERRLPLLRRRVRHEQPADPEMGRGAQVCRDQCIGGFLDAVMEKPIGTFRAAHESRAGRFPQGAVPVLLHVLVDHRQQGKLRAVAQTGQLLQGLLSFDGQAVQLPHHEVHHSIGVPLGVNALQVPRPSRCAMIEGESRLLGKRRHELDGEKWIASRLLVHQVRQRSDSVSFAMKGIRDQLSQIVMGEGRKDDLLHDRSRVAADLLEQPLFLRRPHTRVRTLV
jgi:hypothetical protein